MFAWLARMLLEPAITRAAFRTGYRDGHVAGRQKFEAERATQQQKMQEEVATTISNAKFRADQIIEKTRRDAEGALIAARRRCEELGRRDGYDAGFARGQAEGKEQGMRIIYGALAEELSLPPLLPEQPVPFQDDPQRVIDFDGQPNVYHLHVDRMDHERFDVRVCSGGVRHCQSFSVVPAEAYERDTELSWADIEENIHTYRCRAFAHAMRWRNTFATGVNADIHYLTLFEESRRAAGNNELLAALEFHRRLMVSHLDDLLTPVGWVGDDPADRLPNPDQPLLAQPWVAAFGDPPRYLNDAAVRLGLATESRMRTVRDFLLLTAGDLLAVSDIGPARIAAIRRRLAERDLYLWGDTPISSRTTEQTRAIDLND